MWSVDNITEFNDFLSFNHQVCFLNEYPREEKRSAIFTQEQSQERKKAWFLLRMCRIKIIIGSQTQLEGIANEQTIICRQLFAEKKEKFASNDKSIYSLIIVH